MGRKNLLADLIEESTSGKDAEAMPIASAPLSQPTLGSRGAVGAMSRSLEQLSAQRDAAKALSEQLASGQAVYEIDTALIEESIVPDRMTGTEADHAALVESIRAQGQIVPALLRPHPTKAGHFQIAYGHRRVRAVRALARAVRAIVRELSDDDLVIAQGKENGDRQDLSFIERARYATLLEDRQFKRETIMAALSVDKTELSRMISTARAIPTALAEVIGRAPKVGRRRWIELAERLGEKASTKAIDNLVASSRFLSANTDDRFALVLSAVTVRERAARKPTIWTAGDGKKVAKIDRSADRFILSVDEKLAPAFGDFILERLPELYETFRQSARGDE
ncbi:plasmid partitioning protein RepB [Bradyrhizobium liaoningense]|uniref:plasmid partitioning protein RepB n=1 Tax=Bradyrhizobium liaoningense TaxID=43992 RepID=UPI00235C3838|nr:plasmid partitioning protein RepB [Bradyrhizobium liaoningense]GLR93988.1 plasmid partitioning protein RepB [Bradyrhizobium liaoningense]